MNTLTPNPQLDMLMSREQLMEDITNIVEMELVCLVSDEVREQLTGYLCDAVCDHFPVQ